MQMFSYIHLEKKHSSYLFQASLFCLNFLIPYL